MNRITHRFAFVTALASLLALLGCSGATDTPVPSPGSAVPTEQRFDPTASRKPTPSRSLSLADNWTPPSPTRTRPARLKSRVKPSHQYGVATPLISSMPSDDDFRALPLFVEQLRPVPGSSSDAETRELASALATKDSLDDRAIDGVLRFLELHPKSRWAASLHLNVGSISYVTGYFQDALDHWNAAWEIAKDGEDDASQQLANQALANYAKMNARIGRMAELEAIAAQAERRNFMGDARVKMTSALEGLWTMRNRPGLAFRCGPYALLNIAQQLDPNVSKKSAAFLRGIKSPRTGFSLSQVRAMSSELGITVQMAKREPGASVILPAVVHLKLDHFGALVRAHEGKFLLKDPTFGNETWITREALDRESSGYFIVPAGDLAAGWVPVSDAEGSQVFGKGHSGNIDDKNTGGGDDQVPGDKCKKPNLAMATYTFHVLATSLHVTDTPVGYATAAGPDVRVEVSYNQREAGQPTSIDFTSFGPQFVSNWISYLVDNPSNASANVTLRKPGGGSEVHSNYSSQTQSFGMEPKTASILYRLTPNTYRKVYPDGHEEYFEQYIGTTGTQRRVFLTRVIDPQGNEVSIEYDGTYPSRIHQVIDATGLPTMFRYEYSGQPYLVTTIEDPFGREATFAYASVAGAVRLQSIEDTHGIVSSFQYDTAGEMRSMTTPYGTTTFGLSPLFVSGQPGAGLIRFVEATDPRGQKERLEYNTSTQLTGVQDALEQPYPDSSLVSFWSLSENNDRNSFYWDKLRMQLAPGDYSKAHRYHWLQPDHNDAATGILESEVPPLESRIFYNYPGQSPSFPYIQGTLASRSVVARVVKDAQGNNHTQATRYQYNAAGNVTKTTDPLGRETLIEYGANGVDVVAVKQKTGVSGGQPVWTTMTSYVYGTGAPPHRPTSVADGAGQTTEYTYSSTGQVATIQNAKGELTTFAYETNPSAAAYGKLLSITGDVPGGNRSLTYDSYGRVRTTTNSEGHTLTYDYDALDRVRTITYPDGSFEQLEYEDHSLIATRDREGRWTRHMYNGVMERVVTRDPALKTTQFHWCRCGELQRFVDGNGNITAWTRDEATRVTRKTYANGSFETYAYDFSGRLLSEVDPSSRTVTYEYTLDDRLSKKDYSDSGTPDVTYAYDSWFPRLASRQDGAGTTTFTYHPHGTSTLGAGRFALVNGPFADDTLKHTYDELGRLKKVEIVDDATQSTASYSEEYTFDSRGRVTTVNNNLGSATVDFVGQSGRLSSVTHGNGMQSLYEYYGATGDHLLQRIKNLSAPPNPTLISQFDYTYRQDRSIATWAIDQGSGTKTWTFGYDGARQLTSAELRDGTQTLLESNAYAFDNAGNRIQAGNVTTAPRNYDVNALNQLLSQRDYGKTTFAGFVNEPATVKVNGKPAKVLSTDGGAPFKFEAVVDIDGGANTVVVEAKDGQNNVATKTYGVPTTGVAKTFEYDANGNLRFEKQANGTVIREYRWDQENRLVRMLAGAHESSYEYDGESRRVRIKELENSVETKNETFVWCGSRICQKRSASAVVRSYFADGFEHNATNDYFYTRDLLGSVREVVAGDGITIASRLQYGPWGELTESGSVSSDFAYTGHYIDRPSGLSLAQFRGYDAFLARWVSKDQIGLRGGPNLYGYVNGDPINFVDPDGKVGLAIGIGVGVGVGIVVVGAGYWWWQQQQSNKGHSSSSNTIYYYEDPAAPAPPFSPPFPEPPVPGVDDDEPAVPGTDTGTVCKTKPKKKSCSCTCMRAGDNGINPIGQRTPSQCASDCKNSGYTGFKCGGSGVTWF